MPFVVFVAPYYSEFNVRAIEAAAALDEVSLAVISQEPWEALPERARGRTIGHWRVHDALNDEQLLAAARSLARTHGPIARIFAGNEQVQVPVAHVRERLSIDGMSVSAALNFREK